MALVAIASAKGSPGVTTTALALAALWPREVVLLDCDAMGGDVALRMPAPDGTPIDPDRGLVSVAAAGRNGMGPDLLRAHTQAVAGGLEVVAGLRGPEQAAGLDAFWPALAATAVALPGTDAVADVGRVDADPPALPLLRAAQVVLLVTRVDVASVVHVRERLGALVPRVTGATGQGPLVGVVLVTGPRADRDAQGAQDALSRTATPPHRFWRIALDPRGAAVFAGEHVRRPERTDLARSVRGLAAEVAALVAPAHVPAQAGPGRAGQDDGLFVDRAGPPVRDPAPDPGPGTHGASPAAEGEPFPVEAGRGRRRATRSVPRRAAFDEPFGGPRGGHGQDGGAQ